MNKLLKLFLSFLGVGLVSAASVEYLPSDIPADKVANAYNASKQVKGKYRLENAKMVREAKANPKDRLEIEIGDDGENFKPKVKVERWDDEVNFSLELLDGEKGNTKLETENDKIKWSKGNKTARFYEIESNDDYPEGAFEFDIELAKKPKTNKIEFSLNTKGVDFYYQPALTQQEIDEGAIRPENVVGSYAVYASEQKTNYVGGKEYKTGKVGHIYRPKIYDASGAECWGVLSVDKEAGKLSVEIPQDFLDNAVYPVVIDPTFGYETAGGSTDLTSNKIRGSFFTGSNGTVTSIAAYVNDFMNNSGNWKYGIYLKSDSSLNGYTDSTYRDGSVNAGWKNINISSGGTISATDYYLVGWADYTSTINFDTETNKGGYNDVTYGTFPNPASFTASNNKYSIYATYTEGGGSTRRIIITE